MLVDFGATGVFDRDRPPGVDGALALDHARERALGAGVAESVTRAGPVASAWSPGVAGGDARVELPFSDDA